MHAAPGVRLAAGLKIGGVRTLTPPSSSTASRRAGPSTLRWPCTQAVAAALCLGSMAAQAPAAVGGDAAQAVFAEQVLAAVNHYRSQQALAHWQPADALDDIALDHSRLMAERGKLGHDGFSSRFDRARSGLCVETLAAGFSHADALVAGWRQSTQHHANLLEPRARRAGIASVNGYVTLIACD